MGCNISSHAIVASNDNIAGSDSNSSFLIPNSPNKGPRPGNEENLDVRSAPSSRTEAFTGFGVVEEESIPVAFVGNLGSADRTVNKNASTKHVTQVEAFHLPSAVVPLIPSPPFDSSATSSPQSSPRQASPRLSRVDHMFGGQPSTRKESNPFFICNNSPNMGSTNANPATSADVGGDGICRKDSVVRIRRRSVLFTDKVVEEQQQNPFGNAISEFKRTSGSTNGGSHLQGATLSRNSGSQHHLSIASVSDHDHHHQLAKEGLHPSSALVVEGAGSTSHSYASSNNGVSSADIHDPHVILGDEEERARRRAAEVEVEVEAISLSEPVASRVRRRSSSGHAPHIPIISSTFVKEHSVAPSPSSLLLPLQSGLRTLNIPSPAGSPLLDTGIRNGCANQVPAMQQAQMKVRQRRMATEAHSQASASVDGGAFYRHHSDATATTSVNSSRFESDAAAFSGTEHSISQKWAGSVSNPHIAGGDEGSLRIPRAPKTPLSHSTPLGMNHSPIPPTPPPHTIFVSVLPEQHAKHFATNFPELQERLEASILAGMHPPGSPVPHASPRVVSPAFHGRMSDDGRVSSSCVKGTHRSPSSDAFAMSHPPKAPSGGQLKQNSMDSPLSRFQVPRRISNLSDGSKTSSQPPLSKNPSNNRTLLPAVKMFSSVSSSGSGSSTSAYDDSESGESIIMPESGEDGYACPDMLESMRQTIAERQRAIADGAIKRGKSNRRRNRPSVSTDVQLLGLI